MKVVVWLVCLSTLLSILYDSATHHLPTNQVEYLQNTTGQWALILLMASLAITPLRKIAKLPWLIRFRRLIGLFAFFYICLHFLTYLLFDQQFDLQSIWKDIYKRPFITVGFLAFVLLIPLAVTSTTGWIRRLGGKRWQQLHRAIYVTAVCGVIHYYWLVKSDVRKPLFYGALVGILLLWRLGDWFFKRRSQAPVRITAPGVSVNG